MGSNQDMNNRTITRSRRRFLAMLGFSLPAVWLKGCGSSTGADRDLPFEPLDLDETRWRKILAPARYRILRREGTEPPFSSPLDKEYGDGTYVCAGCFLPLFSSAHKYDSGTGWPSFWRPIAPVHVGTRRDFRLIIPRIEYHCARCGGHQGHVFDDGPQPTGERWCNNGLALEFVPGGTPLPALRTAIDT